MISLYTLFWITIFFFSLVGMLRGWTKEIVATAGLVLSLFAQLWFGHHLVGMFARNSPDVMKTQFVVRSIMHIVFAFFAYQGPTLVRQVTGGRLTERARGTVQEAILGFVVGAINGYLIVGGIWSFLENNIVDRMAIPYAPATPYPFPVEIITRPLTGPAMALIASLPLPALQSWLPLLLVVLFLFVLVAMI
ncbi:MAG: CvpA family protein [Chloroflexota bacterium]